jgi:hypothetical protein
MSVLPQIRKLLLGETWSLPLGIAAAVGAAAVTRGLTPREWWSHDGGFVLLGLLLGALTLSLTGALWRRRR